MIKREPSDEDADNQNLSFYKGSVTYNILINDVLNRKEFSPVKNSISNPTTSIKPGDNDVRIMQSIESMTADEIRNEKFHIWKNIIVISMSFMFLFTAFNSMGNLQVRYNIDFQIHIISYIICNGNRVRLTARRVLELAPCPPFTELWSSPACLSPLG